MSEFTFVAFDVETTGLDAGSGSIVEVGAVRFNREGTVREYSQLVNPGRPIPPEVTAIHGITGADVTASPSIPEVLPQLIELFGPSVLLAHNASFDISFLNAAFAQATTEPPPNAIICTLTLARVMFPGLPDYKLPTLVRRLGIPEGCHHRALADAIHTAEVFRRCLDRGDKSWNTRMEEFLRLHGPPLGFDPTPARTFKAVRMAVQNRTRLRIEYRDARGKVTVREITPASIEDRGRETKVVAYCHTRNDRRTFRLASIQKIL